MAAARGLEMLVIHGGEDAAESLAGVLRRYGHTVATATTGEAGLRAAADRPPDVVVYDLDLSDLDGAGLVSRLDLRVGGRRPLLVGIGCTAGPRAADGEANAYPRKPAEPATLHRLLGRFAGLLGPAA